MKKTIGIITNASKDSGVGARAYEIAKRLNNTEDIDISLISLDGDSNKITSDTLTPPNSPLKRGRNDGPSPFQGEAGWGAKKISRLPGFLGSKSISWMRLAQYIPKFDVYDISNQSLSFIAKKKHPNIVTVHDIIELIDPQDSRAVLLNKYLLSGIRHADKIIAVSEYTKRTIVDYFDIPEMRILVIPNGVSSMYTPIENFANTIAYQELLRDYGVGNRTPIIIYTGSEHPRKNIETTLKTIAMLKKQYPDVLLLKVGEPGLLSGRVKTLECIDTLGLRTNVKLLGNIPTERINELYNIADALLFPSLNEGFGMPPLEAMRAGCPVVCSNATSLPEVVGDGALMHDPNNAEAFAKSIVHIISNSDFRNSLIERGTKRASMFSWDTAARDMLDVYRKLL